MPAGAHPHTFTFDEIPEGTEFSVLSFSEHFGTVDLSASPWNIKAINQGITATGAGPIKVEFSPFSVNSASIEITGNGGNVYFQAFGLGGEVLADVSGPDGAYSVSSPVLSYFVIGSVAGGSIWADDLTVMSGIACDPCGGDPEIVPVPAGLPLAITGIAALGVVRSRRKG